MAATYLDKNRKTPYDPKGGQPIQVTDFYDSGGGLYFTLLLGLEGSRPTRGSHLTGPDDGWVVGEAVAQDGTLQGTIAFYSYANPLLHFSHRGQPDKRPALQTDRRAAQPKPLAP